MPILMSHSNDFYERSEYLWTCRFDSDFCQFKNQYNMASFRRHFDRYTPLFGETSMLYLNVSNAGNYQAARLESDYFATSSQLYACLTIDYLMYGTGPLKMYLIQQDVENKCIWIDNNESIDNYGKWRKVRLTIDMRNGEPRFFIEAHFNIRPPNYGVIAISKISFTYGVCDHSDANQCQDYEDDRNIEPPPPAV